MLAAREDARPPVEPGESIRPGLSPWKIDRKLSVA